MGKLQCLRDSFLHLARLCSQIFALALLNPAYSLLTSVSSRSTFSTLTCSWHQTMPRLWRLNGLLDLDTAGLLAVSCLDR